MEAIQSELILLSLLGRPLELRSDKCAWCHIFVCAVIILLHFNHIVILIVPDVASATSVNDLFNELPLLPESVILILHHVLVFLLLRILISSPDSLSVLCSALHLALQVSDRVLRPPLLALALLFLLLVTPLLGVRGRLKDAPLVLIILIVVV